MGCASSSPRISPRATALSSRSSSCKRACSARQVHSLRQRTLLIPSPQIKDLNAAKGKLPFKSTAEVDAKIRTLESSVDAGTLRLVEEKRTLAEIQALKKQKKQVEGFGPQQTAIEEDRAKVDELRKLLDDPESKAASQRWNDIKAEIDKISQEMQEQGKDRDKLYENRNELQKQLDELYGRKRDSAAKYKEANDKYCGSPLRLFKGASQRD